MGIIYPPRIIRREANGSRELSRSSLLIGPLELRSGVKTTGQCGGIFRLLDRNCQAHNAVERFIKRHFMTRAHERTQGLSPAVHHGAICNSILIRHIAYLVQESRNLAGIDIEGEHVGVEIVAGHAALEG